LGNQNLIGLEIYIVPTVIDIAIFRIFSPALVACRSVSLHLLN